jgi:hypothetical protein
VVAPVSLPVSALVSLQVLQPGEQQEPGAPLERGGRQDERRARVLPPDERLVLALPPDAQQDEPLVQVWQRERVLPPEPVLLQALALQQDERLVPVLQRVLALQAERDVPPDCRLQAAQPVVPDGLRVARRELPEHGPGLFLDAPPDALPDPLQDGPSVALRRAARFRAEPECGRCPA